MRPPRRIASWEVRFLSGAASFFAVMSVSAQLSSHHVLGMMATLGALLFSLALYARGLR